MGDSLIKEEILFPFKFLESFDEITIPQYFLYKF